MLKVPITFTVEDLGEAAEVVRRFLAEGALGERDARAVHQHVEAAELLDRQRHGGLAIGLRRNVGAHEAPADFLGELLAELGLQVGDHHLGAVLGRHARARRAETRRAAGDEEYAISDLHRRLPLISLIILTACNSVSAFVSAIFTSAKGCCASTRRSSPSSARSTPRCASG